MSRSVHARAKEVRDAGDKQLPIMKRPNSRRRSKRSRTQVRPPDLPDEAALQLYAGDILENDTYAYTLFADCSLSGLDLSYLGVERSLFRKVKICDSQFHRWNLSDVRFEGCDLSLSRFPMAGLNRVVFSNCRLTGIQPLEAHFSDVRFVDCTADMALFRFTEFEAAAFEKCSLREADFQNSDLSGVRFVDCDLRSTQLSGCQMEGTDVRGSRLEGLKVGAADLDGVVIDSGQLIEFAHDWARLLGLKVEE